MPNGSIADCTMPLTDVDTAVLRSIAVTGFTAPAPAPKPWYAGPAALGAYQTISSLVLVSIFAFGIPYLINRQERRRAALIDVMRPPGTADAANVTVMRPPAANG